MYLNIYLNSLAGVKAKVRMTVNPAAIPEEKPSDKEYNFRAQEQKFQRLLEEERNKRLEQERKLQELEKRFQSPKEEEDESDDDPYIDHRKLEKKLAKYDQKVRQETSTQIQQAVQEALAEERRQSWMKNNADFYEIMQHADKLQERDPELADTILAMPNNFERQKLVYKSIKAMGLHKKEEPKPIQQTIENNRRAPYYQPTNQGVPPYQATGDFSKAGQQTAYQKMQDLKRRLSGV